MGLAARLEFVDDRAHVLGAIAWNHKNGVIGLDDAQIANAHERPAFPTRRERVVANEVVVGVDGDRVRGQCIAVAVAFGHLPGGFPAANVIPAESPRHHGNVVGLLHHPVIDRDRRQRGKHGCERRIFVTFRRGSNRCAKVPR